MGDEKKFEDKCRELVEAVSKLEAKETGLISAAVRLLREMVGVLPGPIEAMLEMKKSGINFPRETLPDVYARLLYLLKHS